MSLLLAEGHPDARFYPVGMVKDEAQLVRKRFNGVERTRAILLQMAISSVLSEDADTLFKKALDGLDEE